MLYAKINKDTEQMIGVPQELPSNYTYGSGVVIDRFDKLPQNVLYSFDWIPVVVADNPDPMTFYVSTVPEYDSTKKEFNLGLVSRDIVPFLNEAKDAIDRAASDACFRYLSTGIGQEMRYLEKSSEADKCMKKLYDGNAINPEDYPMIHAESISCNMEFTDKLQEIVETKAAWTQLAAKVESIRIGSKRSCEGETTCKGIIDNRDAAITELRAL